MEKIEGKKFIYCIFSNLIEIFDDRIDKTCKIIISDKILRVLEIFSTLSNFKLKIKLRSNMLNVNTFIGMANLRFIYYLNA